MKVFFITPFSEKEKFQKDIDRIIKIIESTGVDVISAEKTRQYKDAFSEENLHKFGSKEAIHYEFIRQGVFKADALIVEVNPGDFRVGHETTLALLYQKPVLCLSKNADYSKYIKHQDFHAYQYTEENLQEIIIDFLRVVSGEILSQRNANFNISSTKWGLEKTKNKINVAVLGSINVDMVTKVPKIPKENEVVISEGLKLIPGGKATNAAIAISRLEENSLMIGKVGNDYFGEDVRNVFRREKVKIEFVDIDNFIPTGTVMVNVDSRGENTIIVNEDANIKINKKSIIDLLNQYDENKIKIDCFYTTLEPVTEIVQFSINEFSKRNIPIICDAGPQARPLPEKLYQKIDFISPNEIEASLMTGIKVTDQISAEKAALLLREKGANNVIITLGAQGAVLLEKGKNSSVYYPGNKVRVVDVTAAGDAFRAGFICAYFENNNINEAMIFANRTGAYAVTKFGAYDSLPTREELSFLEILPS